VRPGATEICNAIDDDCDAMTDEMLTATGCYVDADGDTYGAGASTTQCRDAARMSAGFCPVGYYNRAADCNDANGLVFPTAPEACNGSDDDCDGVIDDGVLNTYYRDADNDGFGATGVTMTGCIAPAGYVAAMGDCNDANASVYPGASEICNNLDNNCVAGTTDEPRRNWYPDDDMDLYGATTRPMSACSPPPGHVEFPGDCNDMNPSIRPGVPEQCNGVDDDCEGGTDESAASQCSGQNPFAVNIATWSCTAGACVPNCTPMRGNCDAMVANGCETNTSNDVNHCSACSMACGTAGTCTAGMCDRVVDVQVGAFSSCVRRSNGRVACWGSGDDGELGDGLLADSTVPVANPDLVEIDGHLSMSPNGGSQTHVMAYSANNDLLYGWGLNSLGQLGDGTLISPRARPVLISSQEFERVAAGNWFTCGIRETAAGATLGVACWGNNPDGQLGYGDPDMNMTCDPTPRTMSVPGTYIAGSTTAVDIAAGGGFACMALSAGGVRCWGNQSQGKLGNGMTTGEACAPVVTTMTFGFVADDVEAGLNHGCAISTTGVARCWGDNGFGQLGNGNTTDQSSSQAVMGGLLWSQLALGANHTCGITTGGNLYCWGSNSGGRLGTGGAAGPFSTPQLVGMLADNDWIDVSAATDHTCALESDGDVFCWGINTQGQLGIGSMSSRSTPTQVPNL
jgi:alpha-tubulin suppressor-like RCC1 family protein